MSLDQAKKKLEEIEEEIVDGPKSKDSATEPAVDHVDSIRDMNINLDRYIEEDNWELEDMNLNTGVLQSSNEASTSNSPHPSLRHHRGSLSPSPQSSHIARNHHKSSNQLDVMNLNCEYIITGAIPTDEPP